MKADAKIRFLVDVLYGGFWVLLTYFVLQYLIWWLLPLLLGFCIALGLRPLVNTACRFSTATRRFCAVMVLLCAYGVLFALLWLGTLRLFYGLQSFFLALPAFYEQALTPALAQLRHHVSAFLAHLSPQLNMQFLTLSQGFSQQLGTWVSAASVGLIAWIRTLLESFPAVVLTFLFTILSSFFILMDYNAVVSFLARLVPKRHRATLFALKAFLLKTVLGYLRAYSILFLLTFLEALAGLLLLRVPGSLWWALAVALLDLLPAIGTGLILLPWALLALLQGQRFLGLGLLLLYGVIAVLRNLLEPKIVGDNIGLPPLVTITALFLGFRVFGFTGMFLAPFFVLILKFLHDTGRIHLWDEPSAP